MPRRRKLTELSNEELLRRVNDAIARTTNPAVLGRLMKQREKLLADMKTPQDGPITPAEEYRHGGLTMAEWDLVFQREKEIKEAATASALSGNAKEMR